MPIYIDVRVRNNSTQYWSNKTLHFFATKAHWPKC